MIKRFLSVSAAGILALLFLGGCFLDGLFGSSDEEQTEKVKIVIDSQLSPTLFTGETYKLLYSCEEEVTVICDGKFNYVTNVFTADRAGEFVIKISAGKGDAYSEERVTVTVLEEANKTALAELVKSTESLIPDDYYNYDSLLTELAFSDIVLKSEKVTKSQLDGAEQALRAAIKSLVPVAFGAQKAVVKEDAISYGGEYYFKNYYLNFNTVAEQLKKINTDDTIKLRSVYDGKVTAELKKLIKFNGKELAEMNFTRGIQMAEKVFDGYYVKRSSLLGGNIVYDVLDKDGKHIRNTSTGNKETDFWSLTSLFALMVRLDTVTEKSYKDKVDAVIEAMAYHRGTRSDNTAGENGAAREFKVYGVHRANKKDGMDVVGFLGRESVFDDQIWAAQEFLNAYNLYGEKSYLDSAVELTEYIYLVGRCEIGGIYWGQGYITRHACSSAPFVKLAVMLFEATGESKYLDWAKDVYKFMREKLRDPADDLYYDLIGTTFAINSSYPDNVPEWENPKNIPGNRITGDGSVDKKKYSYNSGSMVSAGVALYRATGEKHYLEEAEKTAYSCRKYFGRTNVKDGYTVYPGSDGGTTYSWFDLILFKGYFDLYGADKACGELLDDVQSYYDYNYVNFAKEGFMPTSGLTGWTTGRNSYDYRVLMDHVTNADVMLLLGQFKDN